MLIDFRQFALTMGLDPLSLMARAGISRHFLDDPDLRLPMNAVVDLLEIAANASGIHSFGLRFGEWRGVPDLGPIILMLRQENDVRAALKGLISALYVHSNALVVSLEEEGDPIVTVDILGRKNADHRQAIETSVAGMAAILRWVLGSDWSPSLVCFQHDRPTSTLKHEQLFRSEIQFSTESNALVLRPRDLEHPLSITSAGFRRQTERLVRLHAQSTSREYLAQVIQVMTALLPRGEATASNTARLLNTSTRTLHRNLARIGSNYSTLLDQLRRDRVMRCLHNHELSLTDIAIQLGFGSLSAFSRWFAQSFDCAPSQLRAVGKFDKITLD